MGHVLAMALLLASGAVAIITFCIVAPQPKRQRTARGTATALSIPAPIRHIAPPPAPRVSTPPPRKKAPLKGPLTPEQEAARRAFIDHCVFQLFWQSSVDFWAVIRKIEESRYDTFETWKEIESRTSNELAREVAVERMLRLSDPDRREEC